MQAAHAQKQDPSWEARDLLRAKAHFKVDDAISVATMYFSWPAAEFAMGKDILAVQRDYPGNRTTGPRCLRSAR